MTAPRPSDTPRADQWADLRALEAAATPGPWQAAEQTHSEWVGLHSDYMALGSIVDADDATFIAAARNAVPDLLAEVDRLRAALAEAADRVAYLQHRHSEALVCAEQAERQAREIREWARRFRVGDVIDPEDLHDLSAALSGVSGPTEEAEEGLRAFIVDAVRSNRSLPMALLAEYQITRRRPTTEGASE